MSIKKILTTAVLVAAGVVLSSLPARALVYTQGDILLGVRATGGDGSTYVYLVNLGTDTSIINGSFAGTSIGTDLAAIYGDGWNTRSDLYWGVFGAKSASSLYGSRERDDIATQSEAWPALPSTTERSDVQSGINTVGITYQNNSGASLYVPVNLQAGVQSSSVPGGYFTQVSADPNFATTSQWSSIEGSFADGAENSILDFYRVTGSVSTTKYLGSFSISDEGLVTFAAVPEPSTYALLAIAATAFVIFFRRRSLRA